MMMWMNRGRLVTFFIGLVLLVVNERYLSGEGYASYIRYSALVLCAIATLLAGVLFLRARRSDNPRLRLAASWMLGWQGAVLGGLLVYLIYSQASITEEDGVTALTKILLALWVLMVTLGGFLAFGVESTLIRDSSREILCPDPKRLHRAAVSWLKIGVVFATLVCLNYVAVQKNKIFDWSYLKSSSPSSVTISLADSAANELEVFSFYNYDNEVRPFVINYFKSLIGKSKKIKFIEADKDLQPMLAEELKAAGNGVVILRYGDIRERIDIGNDLVGARRTLRRFDGEVQKAMMRLVLPKKKIYFTRGHGEFSWTSTQDPMQSIDIFESMLRAQNYQIHTLGLDEGSSRAIPDDADIVVVVANDQPFLPQEVAAIEEYLNRGGKLALFLDPVAKPREGPSPNQKEQDPLIVMLKKFGIIFERKLVANDRNYIQATRSPADHWFLFSNAFTNHESVASLEKSMERSALFLFQTGYFADTTNNNPDWRVQPTVRSMSESFIDENRNARFDEGREQRQLYTLGLVATKLITRTKPDGKAEDGEAKILALADATAITDSLVKNRTNAVYALDGFKWLVGQGDLMGDLSSEEDVKIRHTNKEDALWFNATVLVVPSLVLILGYFLTRRRKSLKPEVS